MENKIKTIEDLRKRRSRKNKVWCTPRVPQRIDAMYENKAGGNLIAYHYDPDPVRSDQVYKKLEGLIGDNGTLLLEKTSSEQVAWLYQQEMRSREMNQRTYNFLRDTPNWILRPSLTLIHEFNPQVRSRISSQDNYQMHNPEKEWTDDPFQDKDNKYNQKNYNEFTQRETTLSRPDRGCVYLSNVEGTNGYGYGVVAQVTVRKVAPFWYDVQKTAPDASRVKTFKTKKNAITHARNLMNGIVEDMKSERLGVDTK